MTVNSCSRLFLLIFIESVFSIQNTFQQGSSRPICSYPYSCMLTSECAERHSARGTDEVLFQCEEKNTICCPPAKSPVSNIQSTYMTTEKSVPSCTKCSEAGRPPQESYQSQGNSQNFGAVGANTLPVVSSNPNTYTTTERGIPGCTKCSEAGRPPQETYQSQGNSQNFGTVGQHVHTVSNNMATPSMTTRRPIQLPLDSKRPPQTQPAEGRRPPQPQIPQPQNQSQPPLTSHRNFRLLPPESQCGVNNFANRITEGEEVSLGEYPWMVLTGVKDRFGNYRWNCGGTLISGWYVLTAAHCLIVDNRTIEYVRLGEHSLTNDTDCYREICLERPEDIRIAEVIPHERWNTTTIKNDIALLRLSRNPLELGKSNIYPICLPFDASKLNITSSTKYEVAGWGKTDWNAEEGSDVLRKASISGVSREECNICKDKKKQQYCPIINTQLCVQGWKAVDVCKGDSGGPLMITRLNIYQIGITSFKGSEYCGAENIPSIFTKVESFLPWILDNIRE